MNRIKYGYQYSMVLGEVQIYGVTSKPSNVTINDYSYTNFVYDDIYSTLSIKYFDIDLSEFDTITFSWFY